MATENEVDEQVTAADPFTGHVEVVEEPAEGTETEHESPEGDDGGKTKVETPEAITPDNLAEAIKKAFPSAPPQEQKPVEPKKLTPEEYDAQYKVWKPSEDFLQRLQSTDPVIANKALIEMRDSVNQQSLTMAYHLIQEVLKPFKDQLGGIESTTQTLSAERQRERFMTKYPELEEHNDILKMVADQLVASGFKPKNETEAHEKIAQTTEKLIQSMRPEFKLGGQQQKQNKTTTKPKMATTSRGGHGGAGGGNGVTKDSRLKGMDIFD